MHIWPSIKLRDSFKEAYLKKLEWNLHRMNSQKQRENRSSCSSNQQKLLDQIDKNDDSTSGCGGGFVFLCRELLMILSCCYCCFCCGACVEDNESS